MASINLYDETVNALERHGKSPKDVRFISDGISCITWEEFSTLANSITYENGYGLIYINTMLSIVGDDWWLEREEYDGSEWWEFETIPTYIKPNSNLKQFKIMYSCKIDSTNF